MSWFSDFAKTALNEAQKRIDKVLDIEDEISSKPNSMTNFHETGVGDSHKTSNVSMPHSRTPPLSARKASLNSHSSKKRGKPMKLGSSLSKRSTSVERHRSITPSESDEVKKECLLSGHGEQFDEIQLDAENEAQTHDVLTVDSTHASTQPHDISYESNMNHFSPRNCDNEKPEAEQMDNLLSPIYNGSKIVCDTEPLTPTVQDKSKSDRLDSPLSSHSVPQCNGNTLHQTNMELSHSPCGSTTASSEIDILDHESTMSETSTASKLLELDNHLHLVNAENNFLARMSPDRIDSEASDIVRISGYCSSPLSMDGCDGTPVFIPHAKSPVQFVDQCEVDLPAAMKPKELKISHKEDAELNEQNSIKLVDARTCEDEFSKDLDENTGGMSVVASPLQSDSRLEIELLNMKENNEEDLQESEESNVDATPEEITPEEMFEDNRMMTNDNLQASAVEEDICQVENNEFNNGASSNRDVMKNSYKSAMEEAIEPSTNSDQPITSMKNTIKQEELLKLNEKFEVYEQQLMAVSLSNAKLSEENDNLRSELANLKFHEDENLQQKQQNMLQTIENLSDKLQTCELQRSDIADKLAIVQADLCKRLSNEEVQHLLSEKEESIKGLLQEGEALSKQHLQQNNNIKKLRSKLIDREATNKEIVEKLTKYEEENQSLKYRLNEIQGQSSEDRGAAERLSEAYQEREMELCRLRNLLEEAEEKKRAAESTLDAAYRDLAELNKKQATLQSERDIEMEQHEIIITKKMQQEIDRIQQDHEHQMHMRMLQIGELHDSVERAEAISTRKEDQLKKEINDLHQRLQDSELRNHELSSSISESTRPLLRQMENLQSTYSTQTKTWEALEKSLTSRLGDAQIQLAASQDKERSLQMALLDYKSRIGSLEQQVTESIREKSALCTEVDNLRSNTGEHDQTIARLTKELDQSEQNCEEIKSKARRDRLTLENQLDMEKVRSEVDKKKFLGQLEASQKEKERLLWLSRSESITSANLLNTDAESTASSTDTYNHLDVFERQLSSSGPPSGVYDSVRSGTINDSTILENLQSQLKMRDGEIAQLQGEINTLERTRSSMAEEIVRLTNDNEDLEVIANEVKELKTRLKDVESRHEAALTMYGEKAEEAEELRLDLQDVKSMYRQQIDSLLKSETS